MAAARFKQVGMGATEVCGTLLIGKHSTGEQLEGIVRDF